MNVIGVIQSSLSNIAIIFLMHLCVDNLVIKKERIPYYSFRIGVILVVSSAVIAMFYLPIRFGEYQFDLRLIPLVFLAFMWGWRYVIPALVISCFWRLGMGGEGAIPGLIFGMLLPVLLTLVIQYFKKSAVGFSTLFYLITISWLLSDVPIIFIVPDGWSVFKGIVIIRYISFLLTAFTLLYFIQNSQKEIQLKNQLQYFAERDSLTGLYNIRHFKDKVASFQVYDKQSYIAMIDIDHFKSINDTYGHLNGDLILKNVTAVILNKLSTFGDRNMIVGRYGGEEFIVFMCVNSTKELTDAVEGIREEIATAVFYMDNNLDAVNLTVSIGVSRLDNGSALTTAIDLADQALYDSKKQGRNQISYADHQPPDI